MVEFIVAGEDGAFDCNENKVGRSRPMVFITSKFQRRFYYSIGFSGQNREK